MKNLKIFIAIALCLSSAAFGEDVRSIYTKLGLREYQCHSKGIYTSHHDGQDPYRGDYLFPMNVFAKSIEEAYQLALNKLEVRRLNDTGDYTSVPPGPKDGTGMATVTDLNCRVLPIQQGQLSPKDRSGDQILGAK